jgi:hypothetical protein
MMLTYLAKPERSLCWVAPVAESSELATEDPLAFEYIAQQVGLKMLPALTTRSSRAQAFAMVLYGLDLAERAIAEYGAPATDESRRLLFERWERFWALATMEYRDGVLLRGDTDAMRGVRGATTAWRPGNGPLALDYPLISRQQELGNLGAYLSPLRRAGLVHDGTLKPTPAALDIIDAFWDEPTNRSRSRYDDFAMRALDRGRTKIERISANLTLKRVGEASSLSALTRRKRVAQQGRLFDALFQQARDTTTLAMVAIVDAAARARVYDSDQILDGAIAGRFGAVAPDLRDLLITARRVGDATDAMLSAFDRIYTALHSRGWNAPAAAIALEALDSPMLTRLRTVCAGLLSSPRAAEVRTLPMHGGACMRLAEELTSADAASALDALLRYHATVQRERRRGEGWIRTDGSTLVLLVTSYTARPDADRFPPFKLGTVRSLLIDTGRLADDVAITDEDAAS